ncbi:MAG: hypothetical protein IPM32_14330 [Ignavibacteriae bacterium]|nr:hypothetical protein [Ignavibacteriota bacterium]
MKALIIYHTNALEPAHSDAVKTAFINGGGINADIYLITIFNQAILDYARDNNYDAIIYSYEGLSNFLQLAINNPDIMIFMPTHSSYAEQIQQLVVTESLQDLQGGEFEFKDSTQNKDSFSNGYICGQLFKIAELRNCNLQDARFLANKTKNINGIINVNDAINYQTEIFIDEPKEIELEYLQDYQVKVNCDIVRDATEYEYQILKENNYIGERERIIEFSDSEERFIKYRAIRGSNISNWSELFKIYPLEERRKKMGKVSMFSQVGVRRKELVEDVPTDEGQKYVSKIVNGVMQMVKVPDLRMLVGRFTWEDTPSMNVQIYYNTIGPILDIEYYEDQLYIIFPNNLFSYANDRIIAFGYQNRDSKLQYNIETVYPGPRLVIDIKLDNEDSFENGGSYDFAIGLVNKYNQQNIYKE